MNKRRTWIIGLLLLIVLVAVALGHAWLKTAPVQVLATEVSPASVGTGQSLKLAADLRLPWRVDPQTIVFNDFSTSYLLPIDRGWQAAGWGWGTRDWHLQIRLQTTEPGTFRLPPVSLRVAAQELTIIHPAAITVIPITPENPTRAPAAADKIPSPEPVSAFGFWFAMFAMAVLLFSGVSLFVGKPPQPSPLPPEKIALRNLATLDPVRLPAATFAMAVTDALRAYFENARDIPARACTSRECVECLSAQTPPLPADVLKGLAGLLRQTDAIKFGGTPADPEQLECIRNDASQLISHCQDAQDKDKMDRPQ